MLANLKLQNDRGCCFAVSSHNFSFFNISRGMYQIPEPLLIWSSKRPRKIQSSSRVWAHPSGFGFWKLTVDCQMCIQQNIQEPWSFRFRGKTKDQDQGLERFTRLPCVILWWATFTTFLDPLVLVIIAFSKVCSMAALQNWNKGF